MPPATEKREPNRTVRKATARSRERRRCRITSILAPSRSPSFFDSLVVALVGLPAGQFCSLALVEVVRQSVGARCPSKVLSLRGTLVPLFTNTRLCYKHTRWSGRDYETAGMQFVASNPRGVRCTLPARFLPSDVLGNARWLQTLSSTPPFLSDTVACRVSDQERVKSARQNDRNLRRSFETSCVSGYYNIL